VAPLLALLVAGCEGPRTLVVNGTSCPIKVTYSAVAIRDRTSILAPGASISPFGSDMAKVPLDKLTVIDGTGQVHEYDRNTLATLQARSGAVVYSSAGLRPYSRAGGPETRLNAPGSGACVEPQQ
jgi:hypothetical protein